MARVNAGELHVDASDSYPLSDIALVHEQSVTGKIRGKVLLIPAS